MLARGGMLVAWSMDIEHYLRGMVEHQASDLFFSDGTPVGIKIEGHTERFDDKALGANDVQRLAYSLLDEAQIDEFETELELNLAVARESLGQFRINLFRQRGSVAMVIRHIKSEIPSIEALNLPSLLKELIMIPRGLILVVGAAGSGKSTTLASMIDYRNQHKSGHILTIEEPIEFVHEHKQSIVDQRELGLDTLSYSNALKNAMREAPDVILIGEIRDRETMKHAIAYAETGHLCLSTLHSSNANQTLDRIINFFPETAHRQLFVDLADHLQAIVSQRLVPSVDAYRVPAVELLIRTPYVSDLIRKNDIDSIKEAMKEGGQAGMRTFDQALLDLYREGRITKENALEYADSRNDLGLAIRMLDQEQPERLDMK